MFFNIALFLIVAAIFIAVYKPESKSDAWIFSLVIPIVLLILVTVYYSFSYGSETNFAYSLGTAIADCLASIIISFITLFKYLRKKYVAGDQFRFPKGLIVAIVVFVALGLFSAWGNYRREKVITEREKQEISSQKDEKQEISSQKDENEGKAIQEDMVELNNDVIEARKVLPELVEFLKQGLPATREGMSWTDVEIDNNALIYHITIDENVINFNEVTKYVESDGLDFFQSINAKNPQLIKKVRLAKYNFSVEFKGRNSGRTKWVTVLADEIQKASN